MNDLEKDLLIKSKNGNTNAFAKLVETYQKKVFNIAFRMLGNYNDAADLSQEVFIKVFKSLKSFKEQAMFSTWIYRITSNACLDELRKRKNIKFIYIDEEIKTEDGEVQKQIAFNGPSPEESYETKEIKEAVSEAIHSLSEEHRLIIILRDIQGFSYDEISRIIKIPEGTVKSRINRARQALRNILSSKRELWAANFVKRIERRDDHERLL